MFIHLMKKLIYCVLDGAPDTPVPGLGNKTPLEVANKPNIDRLARLGVNGQMQILSIPPESDEAVISLLGYDVFSVYTGRGPLEAVGGGVSFKDGDVAIRCNLGTLENGEVVDVRTDLTTEEAKQLEWAVNEQISLTGATFSFKITTGYRGVLVLRSRNKLSARVTNTHPGYVQQMMETSATDTVFLSRAITNPNMILRKVIPMVKNSEATFTANLMNEFIEKSHQLLNKHQVNVERTEKGLPPANIILTRDAGDRLPRLYNFPKTYDMKWACFSDMPVERGIAQLSGMQIIPIPEPSSDMGKDMYIRAITLLKNMELYDAFYIHLKGPDIYAHVGDYNGKIKSIEEIDNYFFGSIIGDLDMENTIIVITSDHTTSSVLKAHTENPVPLTIAGAGIIPDGVQSFNETECIKGSLKHFEAINLMPTIVKWARR